MRLTKQDINMFCSRSCNFTLHLFFREFAPTEPASFSYRIYDVVYKTPFEQPKTPSWWHTEGSIGTSTRWAPLLQQKACLFKISPISIPICPLLSFSTNFKFLLSKKKQTSNFNGTTIKESHGPKSPAVQPFKSNQFKSIRPIQIILFPVQSLERKQRENRRVNA